MAVLTPQSVVDAGTKPNYSLDTAGLSNTAAIGNGHNSFVIVKNADSSSHTATVTVYITTDYGVAVPNRVVTVASSTGEVWIPLRKSYDDGTGYATITLDAATSVSMALVVVS